MTVVLQGLCRAIMGFCALMAVTIIGALTVQIFSRYVLNAPVHMTDDIAEISLIWMTFLGAAAVYREQGHIAVELIQSVKSEGLKRGVRILIHVLIIAVLAFILTQVQHLRPLMSRLEFGTVPNSPFTSKFALILVPFGLGAALTIVFAIEAIVNEFPGKDLHE